MKHSLIFIPLIFFSFYLNGQSTKFEWVSTTKDAQWEKQEGLNIQKPSGKADVEILTNKPLQTIEGFGGCFNDLGWTSLTSLKENDRESIMKELFAKDYGANFNICRMPVGANDFSRDWFSCDDTQGDFDMLRFNIANDMNTLVPFIKDATGYRSDLKLWASPWSPPAWMKYNKHYACAIPEPGLDKKFQNGLDPNMQGKEGTNMFIQNYVYFQAYALYFSKFIDAYRKEGINISTIMPQNEFNSSQIFPSCTWTASGLATFIGKYLGPEMEKQKVEIMFGTMERPNESLVDTILKDNYAGKYIKGVGFQWGGKKAIAGIHKRYPKLKLWQTEQECGDGKNDWKYCQYAWTLMKHYINSGANAYMYWNISLFKGGYSRWGWQQNSLVTVDSAKNSYHFNYEYYLMKHASHYVKPGAKLLQTKGSFDNLLAFLNPDKSIVVIMQNESNEKKTINIKVGERIISPLLKPDSFNTILLEP